MLVDVGGGEDAAERRASGLRGELRGELRRIAPNCAPARERGRSSRRRTSRRPCSGARRSRCSPPTPTRRGSRSTSGARVRSRQSRRGRGSRRFGGSGSRGCAGTRSTWARRGTAARPTPPWARARLRPHELGAAAVIMYSERSRRSGAAARHHLLALRACSDARRLPAGTGCGDAPPPTVAMQRRRLPHDGSSALKPRPSAPPAAFLGRRRLEDGERGRACGRGVHRGRVIGQRRPKAAMRAWLPPSARQDGAGSAASVLSRSQQAQRRAGGSARRLRPRPPPAGDWTPGRWDFFPDCLAGTVLASSIVEMK